MLVSPEVGRGIRAIRGMAGRNTHVETRTKENYLTRTRLFVNGMENYRLDAVSPELIESYLAKRAVSPTAKDSDLRVIKAFSIWATDRPRRWLTINPPPP